MIDVAPSFLIAVVPSLMIDIVLLFLIEVFLFFKIEIDLSFNIGSIQQFVNIDVYVVRTQTKEQDLTQEQLRASHLGVRSLQLVS